MATKATPEAINALIDASNVTLKQQIDNNAVALKNQIAALDWSAPVVPPVIPPLIPPVTPPSGNPGGTVSKPISLSGVSGQTITGLTITGGGAPCIMLKNCSNMHITLCKLTDSTSSSGAVYLSNCFNITVDFNYIATSPRLVYAESCPQGGIRVDNNQFYNPLGPVKPSGAGQACQFNGVGTMSVQNSISNNSIQTLAGNTGGEDKINLYKSNGTAALPILVNGNKIVNGSSSKTGGGIMLGDNGGSYQSADGNILVNPGQYGMAIAGGDHISITNNQVFGAKSPVANVGIYVWDNGTAFKITNPTVSNNKVTWTNSAGANNPQWLGTGAPTPAGWATNNWAAGLTAAILPNPLF